MARKAPGYSKRQRRAINAAKERGQAVWGNWLKRKIDRSFTHSASSAAKLSWLDKPKPVAPQTTDPKWDRDDLETLALPPETIEELNRCGLNSVHKLSRCEALGKLPTHLDQPAISAALTTWMGTTNDADLFPSATQGTASPEGQHQRPSGVRRKTARTLTGHGGRPAARE